MNRFKNLTKNIIFSPILIGGVVISTFLLNSLEFVRAVHVDEFSIDYKFDRINIKLKDGNYIEFFRLQDYTISNEDKHIQLINGGSIQMSSSITNDLILNRPRIVEEKVYSNQSDIETRVEKIGNNILKIDRNHKINDQTVLEKVDYTYIQLVLLKDSYMFDGENIFIGRCIIRTNLLNSNYNIEEREEFLLLSRRIENNETEFSLQLEIYCK